MVEKLLAAAGLFACLLTLLWMALGPRRRARLRATLMQLLHWRRNRAAAQREAEQAIARVRRSVERDGNVYRPKSFDRRPPDDKLH